MYFLIHQNTDLCDVSGFAFESLPRALFSAIKRLGVPSHAVPAEVRLDNGPSFPCHVVRPVDGSTVLCQEGRMTLIAQNDVAIEIAMRLTRRNESYGRGQVVMCGTPWLNLERGRR